MSFAGDTAYRPRVYLETYGCQMNVADSQTVRAVMRRPDSRAPSGPRTPTSSCSTPALSGSTPKSACSGGSANSARLKRRRPGIQLGLLGCMAQHNRAAMVEKAPWLDLVAGPDSYRRLPELIGRAGFDPAVDVAARSSRDLRRHRARVAGAGVRAYVTAMRGCDKFCAFCVVPYVRGRERSVPADAVIREVTALAARGVKEVVLLGQTVNAYRFGEIDFGGLLRMVAAVGGIERIRFTSPHPGEMSESVIEAMATEPKVQPYLHLPVQSGSNRVLAAMDRGYTVEHYLDLVSRLREAIPGLALSTDIIVGFHGEEESDFNRRSR